MTLPPLPPADPGVPELHTLLGPEARLVVEAGLGRPVRRIEPTYARYRPGSSLTVSYSVQPEGHSTSQLIAAYAGDRELHGVTVVGSVASEISMWNFPFDPALPGLEQAGDPDRVTRLLREVGVKDAVKQIRTRTYRPRRRAVVEVETARHRLFLKVVRPAKAEPIHRIHEAVSGNLRVPRSLGYSAALGIVVLEPIIGSTLRRAVSNGEEPLPDGRRLAGLLEALPAAGSTRPGLASRAHAHKRFLATVLPDQRRRIDAVVGAIPPIDDQPVPAHNDFHSSQVLVDGGEVSGLIDIDTVGPGSRVDDYALLLGHLHSLALGPGGRRFAEYGSQLLDVFESEVGRDVLRPRIAAALVGFATGPFRSQHANWPEETVRRLDAAAAWLGQEPA